MRTVCIWLAAMLLATPALAGDLFGHPSTPAQVETILRAAMPDLGQVQVLRGRYRQRRILHEIPRPLLSSGEFLLVRDRGIWWHTLSPLESELTLGSGGPLRQSGAELAAPIFFALFALDLERLARSFDLFILQSGTSRAPRWVLGLRPRDAALAAWFDKATLSGGARVEQVTLFESTGDRTEIDLDALAHPRSSLTPAERTRLDP